MHITDTYIAGVQFRPAACQAAARNLAADEPLTLEREPNNKHDSNAIKIMSTSGLHLGYVPRHIAKGIAPEIDAMIMHYYGVAVASTGEKLPPFELHGDMVA